MRGIYWRARDFFIKHERHLSVGAFVLGFVIDNFTLTRIDLFLDNLILFLYLVVAGAVIVFLSFYERGFLTGKLFASIRLFAPIVMQFAFGGLFSGFFIFYSRSASLTASWPFLLVLLFLLLGNEFFKTRYTKITFQISIFYFVLFSFLIFYVPVALGIMGIWIFLLSGLLSIIVIRLFIKLLTRISSEQMNRNKNSLTISIACIFITINVMYFANIIPPIPLSLKDAGVYHFVAREKDNYNVLYERKSWREHMPFNEKVVNLAFGEPVYFYSAVFAPTKINIPIAHEWQYFDKVSKKWVISSRISFQVSGGRDGGYRGYTFKKSVPAGKWRVSVVTERGQILGRVNFIINKVKTTPRLEQKIIQ